MRANKTVEGRGSFEYIIVTRPDGTQERYDPVHGSMDDMESCKALAACRSELIEGAPHLREVFYGRAG